MRRRNWRLYLLSGVVFAATTLNLTTTLYSQRQEHDRPVGPQNLEQRVKELRDKFPVADHEAPEPADPGQRAKRRKRSERHDDSLLGVKGVLNAPPDYGTEAVLTNHWEVHLPRLPSGQSDVVLIGKTLDANAYLSADKNGVYSEFTVQVEDVLKNAAASQLSPGDRITAERQGGRVSYPSGRVGWFRIRGQSMPTVNSRYVFFLKQVDPDSFSIITGYELRDDRVYALDSGASQFTVYDGSPESSFLQLVREAIAAQ